MKPKWNSKWKRWEVPDDGDGVRGLTGSEMKLFMGSTIHINDEGVHFKTTIKSSGYTNEYLSKLIERSKIKFSLDRTGK